MDIKDYANTLAMPLTQEQIDADKALRALGKRFAVDYGFHNLFTKARQALADAKSPPRVM